MRGLTIRFLILTSCLFDFVFLSSPRGQAAEVEIILSKHAEALGGLANLEKISSSFSKARITLGGLTGTLTSFEQPPDRFRHDLDLGLLKISQGSDGTNWWVKDQNGIVREMGEKEKEEFRSELFFYSFRYLFLDRFKMDRRFEAGRSDSAVYAIYIKPEGLQGRTLYINRRTFLVDRTEQMRDGQIMTLTYADYRPVAGVMVPFYERQSTGNPLFDIEARVQEIQTNVILAPELFLPPDRPEKDFVFLNNADSTTLPFELANNHIFFKAVLNGHQTGWFILDSGAGTIVFDSAFAGAAGLFGAGGLEAKGISGSEKAMVLRLGTLELGDLRLDSLVAATLKFGPLASIEGRPIDGVIGYDLFARVIVQIDYEQKLLTLREPATFHYTGIGTALPISLEMNIPHIEGTVDGEYAGLFNIDTGSRSTLDLFSPFVYEHQLDHKYPRKIEALVGGIGSGQATWIQMTRMKSFRLGPYTITEPLVGLTTAQSGFFATEKFQGNIGGGLLKHFTVILNYPGKKLILEPNSQFGHRDEFDKSGLWLVKRESRHHA